MALNIIKRDDYILVECSAGINYWEILNGIFQICSTPEFRYINDIWIFKDGPVKLLFSDLYQIKNTAEKLCPEHSSVLKTAIVTETGIQKSLATMYADICKDRPREIGVFSDLNSAEDWIKI